MTTLVTGSGPDVLILHMSQDYYEADAQFTVSVDQVQQGGTFIVIDSATHGSAVDTFTFQGAFGSGAHTVTVDFLNDLYGGPPPNDRNLYVESGTFNGVPIPGLPVSLFSAGPVSIAVPAEPVAPGIAGAVRAIVAGGTLTLTTADGSSVTFTGAVTAPPAPPAPPPPAPSPAPAPAPPAPPAAAQTIIRAPAVPQPSGPNDALGFNLVNATMADAPARAITFGIQFEQGVMPAKCGVGVVAGGTAYAAQLDVKTAWPDGSAQTGVLSVLAPAVLAEETLGCMIVRAAAPTVFVVGALAKPLGVTLTNGETFTLDVQSLLKASPTDEWLVGPVATQYRASVLVSGSLRIVIDVTFFRDNTSLVVFGLNNDLAMTSIGGAAAYDVDITHDGLAIWSRAGIKQPQYTAWRFSLCMDGAGEMIGTTLLTVQRDVASLLRTGIVPNFGEADGVAEDQCPKVDWKIDTSILGACGWTKDMEETGERNDIGWLPGTMTAWLLTQDPDAADYCLAQAEGAGSVPWSLWDPSNKDFVTLQTYPNLWIDGRAAPNLTPPTQLPDTSVWKLDTAHMPNMSLLAYLMTGSRWHLDRLNATATATVTLVWPGFRSPPNTGATPAPMGAMCVVGEQERAQGWSLRTVGNAALVNPDGSAMKAYFETVLANSLAWLTQFIGYKFFGELAGFVVADWNTGDISPWQQDFVAISVGLLAQRGVPGAAAIAQWMEGYIYGRYEQLGLYAENYRNQVGFGGPEATPPTAALTRCTTWAQVKQLTEAAWPVNATYPRGVQTFASYSQSGRAAVCALLNARNSARGWAVLDLIDQLTPADVTPAARAEQPKYNIVPMHARPAS